MTIISKRYKPPFYLTPQMWIYRLLLVECYEIEQLQETMDTFSLVTISREISGAIDLLTICKEVYGSWIHAFAK